MFKDYGIEETRLTREEFIEYANSVIDINMDYVETLLEMLDSLQAKIDDEEG